MKKQNVIEKSSENALIDSESKMKAWYENEFMPYKDQKNKEKAEFKEFAKIVISNTKEVKHMLASIYDNNTNDAVNTWNALLLKPEVKEIKLVNDLLIITDVESKDLSINFEELLFNIEKVLGE